MFSASLPITGMMHDVSNSKDPGRTKGMGVCVGVCVGGGDPI